MSVHVLHSREDDLAILYCSTSDWGFGPVFHPADDYSAGAIAEAFLLYMGATDARWLSDSDLARKVTFFYGLIGDGVPITWHDFEDKLLDTLFPEGVGGVSDEEWEAFFDFKHTNRSEWAPGQAVEGWAERFKAGRST